MFQRFLLALTLVLGISFSAQASDSRATVLKNEFDRFYALVTTLKADGKIGDFMKYKKVGAFTVLWDLGTEKSDYDLIRLYNEHKDGTDSFAVSYYRSQSIVPERTVIRRFVGPGIKDWRNDTMDVDTGEYLGMQGIFNPEMNDEDRTLVKEFNVELFD